MKIMQVLAVLVLLAPSARAVSVHSSGILHSLEKIYRMKKLAGEIRKAAKL